MDKELNKIKVENWLLWQQAETKARIAEANTSKPPAIVYSLLVAFLYATSLSAFSAIVPALRNYEIEIILWSSGVGLIYYLIEREKEKNTLELANSIFRELMSNQKSR
jgi:hypothetical protein